ncbi:hypothetical protein ACWGJ0_20710 [Streptomyces massasporeus]
MAAATLPLQLALASQHNRLHPGMTIALFGLADSASGASGAVMLFNWGTGETHQDVPGRGDCGRAQNMDTRRRAAGRRRRIPAPLDAVRRRPYRPFHGT